MEERRGEMIHPHTALYSDINNLSLFTVHKHHQRSAGCSVSCSMRESITETIGSYFIYIIIYIRAKSQRAKDNPTELMVD